MANLSRRRCIKKIIATGATFFGVGVFINACGDPSEQQNGDIADLTDQKSPSDGNQCDDFSEISETELVKRERFGYVKETALPESKCNNCQLWIMPKENQLCGGCMLFEGPVYDDAYCTYWAPQV